MAGLAAELGRQPWAVEGVLPTAVAVSELSASTVLFTLLGFVAIYTVLIVVEMKLMLQAIRKGPSADIDSDTRTASTQGMPTPVSQPIALPGQR